MSFNNSRRHWRMRLSSVIQVPGLDALVHAAAAAADSISFYTDRTGSALVACRPHARRFISSS